MVMFILYLEYACLKIAVRIFKYYPDVTSLGVFIKFKMKIEHLFFSSFPTIKECLFIAADLHSSTSGLWLALLISWGQTNVLQVASTVVVEALIFFTYRTSCHLSAELIICNL